MPLLLNPRENGPPMPVFYHTPMWLRYQTLRFMFIWAALLVLAVSHGLLLTTVTAMLFGLTLRFDYWSNGVELLAGVLVYSAASNGWDWGLGLALGLVLGAGRETLPILALAGGWFAAALSAGAAATQLVLRRITKTSDEFKKIEHTAEYGHSQIVYNLSVLTNGGIRFGMEAAFYVAIAALAFFSAPLLTLGLVAVTFTFSKIDEPRVLTMLVPWAAGTLCRLA